MVVDNIARNVVLFWLEEKLWVTSAPFGSTAKVYQRAEPEFSLWRPIQIPPHLCVQTAIWCEELNWRETDEEQLCQLFLYLKKKLTPGLAQCIHVPFSWGIWITACLKATRITRYRKTWDMPDSTEGQHKASCFGLGFYWGATVNSNLQTGKTRDKNSSPPVPVALYKKQLSILWVELCMCFVCFVLSWKLLLLQ